MESGNQLNVDQLHQLIVELNKNMDTLRAELASTTAGLANVEIRQRNTWRLHGAPHICLPLRKCIAGDGYALAVAITPEGMPLPPQPANSAQVGAVPVPFNDEPSSYTDEEILDLVIFYNDAFHIQPEDAIGCRQDKLRIWLTGPGM